MAEVTFIDSTGLHLLLDASHSADGNDWTFFIVRPSTAVATPDRRQRHQGPARAGRAGRRAHPRLSTRIERAERRAGAGGVRLSDRARGGGRDEHQTHASIKYRAWVGGPERVYAACSCLRDLRRFSSF
jgi:hypothetical protein